MFQGGMIFIQFYLVKNLFNCTDKPKIQKVNFLSTHNYLSVLDLTSTDNYLPVGLSGAEVADFAGLFHLNIHSTVLVKNAEELREGYFNKILAI